MEALQEHMKQLTLDPEEFVKQLPEGVQVAVKALEGLQEKHDDLEEEYEKERAALEAKYEAMYAPLYAERAQVVKGEKKVEGAGDAKGVPNFWQTVLLRCDATRDTMNEKDVDVLAYCTDVTCETLQPEPRPAAKEGKGEGEDEDEDEDEDEPATGGFRVRMHFAPDNPYFSNTVLEKTYYMLEGRDAVLARSEGTEIDWKAGKNVTVKLMKKKPKKGGKPDAKPQTKLEPVDSFFNFFSPPQVPDEEADLDPEEVEALEEAIEADYDIGDTIRRSIVPNAVGWFTGNALDEEEGDMYGMDEDEDEDEDEDDEDDEEDEDEDSPPRPRRRGAAASGKRAPGAAAGAGGEQPQECKQQ